ncbi:SapB/AmfS family lanthipeptide [Streptomyces sp. 184]
MALLDLQALEASEQTDGGGDSSLSLLCGKHSSHSVLLCL